MGSCLSAGAGRDHRCTVRDCGCAGFAQDNYGEVGRPQRCGCGHERGLHNRLNHALVDDADTVRATKDCIGLPDKL
jgi:hypothetical protein